MFYLCILTFSSCWEFQFQLHDAFFRCLDNMALYNSTCSYVWKDTRSKTAQNAIGDNIDAQLFSNFFEGCEKIREGVLYFRVLLHFYVTIFQSLLRGYMRCPPSLPPPLCASMGDNIKVSTLKSDRFLRILFYYTVSRSCIIWWLQL